MAVVVLALLIGVSAFDIASNARQPPLSSAAVSAEGPRAPAWNAVAETIIAAQLFGEAAAPVAAPAEIGDEVFGLVLKGILHSNVNARSMAIVASPEFTDRLVSAGTELPNGSIVRDIDLAFVVVEWQGRLGRLALPTKSGSAQTGAALLASAADATDGAATSDVDAQVTGQALEQLGAAALLDHEGAVVGLQGNANERWRSAGLMADDTIVAIDDVSTASLVGDANAMARLASTGGTRVTVMRDGQAVTLGVGIESSN